MIPFRYKLDSDSLACSQFSSESFVESGGEKGVEFGGGLSLQALQRVREKEPKQFTAHF
jgi:hypothetical protein